MHVGLLIILHSDRIGRWRKGRSQGGGNQTSKRVCESFTPHEGESRYQSRGRVRERGDYRRDYTPSSMSATRNGRDQAHTAVFSDQDESDRRRGSPPGRYGGRRRDSW
jgi:hypothetical protein